MRKEIHTRLFTEFVRPSDGKRTTIPTEEAFAIRQAAIEDIRAGRNGAGARAAIRETIHPENLDWEGD
jgi:hypothetical protein